jgi:hypothetical protein
MNIYDSIALLEWEEFRKKVAEKIKIHILRSKTFFNENRDVCGTCLRQTAE